MIAGQECKKSWVCPSDRELRIRGRLNYGWSVNTTNWFRKVEVMPREEIEVIEKVIRRARELEMTEVERVGRLLCRLENMAKNAVGDGLKTCSMCGTPSGYFKNSFVNCLDCAKAVCEKCRVEFEICMLCKICSENREVWKKSGGWFYGKFPTMTEENQKDCAARLSGSSGAFNTWEHRAPDIVRMESFEPPEENHNHNSLYKDWSMNSIVDLNSGDDISDRDGENAYDTSCIELTSIHTTICESKPTQSLDCLAIQNPKMSASCPSLSELQEESKLKRKPSIRRKKMSNSARKMMGKISNIVHHG